MTKNCLNLFLTINFRRLLIVSECNYWIKNLSHIFPKHPKKSLSHIRFRPPQSFILWLELVVTALCPTVAVPGRSVLHLFDHNGSGLDAATMSTMHIGILDGLLHKFHNTRSLNFCIVCSFGKPFVDVREEEQTFPKLSKRQGRKLMNLHNNEAGRLVQFSLLLFWLIIFVYIITLSSISSIN